MTGGERVLSWHDRSLIPNLAFIGLVLACVAIVQPDVQGIWIPLAALAGMPLLLNPTVELKGRQLVVNKWWEASRGRTRSTYAIDPRWNWLRRRNRGPWELVLAVRPAAPGLELSGGWLQGPGRSGRIRAASPRPRPRRMAPATSGSYGRAADVGQLAHPGSVDPYLADRRCGDHQCDGPRDSDLGGRDRCSAGTRRGARSIVCLNSPRRSGSLLAREKAHQPSLILRGAVKLAGEDLRSLPEVQAPSDSSGRSRCG
jgi:hypothetical protein